MKEASDVIGFKKFFWLGWAFAILGALPFFPSMYMKFTGSEQMMEGWNHLGWQMVSVTMIGVIEAISVLLFLIPKTTVLGGILLTGYLGGVIATHLRIGEPVYIPVVLGVLIWGSLFLRAGRVRQLIPIVQ